MAVTIKNDLVNSYPHDTNGIKILIDQFWHYELDDTNNILTNKRLIDPRIELWVNAIGHEGLSGMNILELGPHEGYMSRILEEKGASSVTGIEGVTINYLKCLLVKEYYQLKKTKFLLGDIVKYLENNDDMYDCIFASGVLYHMLEPYHVLDLIMKKTNRICICTTYYDDIFKFFVFTGEKKYIIKDGIQFTMHRQNYGAAQTQTAKWQGGINESSYLITKDDLIKYLELSGFKVDILQNICNEKCVRIRIYAEKYTK